MSYVDETALPRLQEVAVGDRVAAGLFAVLLALYPFHRLATVWFPLNFSWGDPVVALLLALWVAGLLGHYALPRRAWLVPALVGVCLLTVAYNDLVGPEYVVRWTGLVEVLKLLGAIAWAGAVFAVAYGRSDYVVPVGVLVSVAIGTWFAADAVHNTVLLGQGRQTGPFHNANIFAHYLALNAFLALSLWDSWLADRGRWLGPASVAAVPVLVFGLAVTSSRGAMVGVVFGVAALVVLSERVRWWMVAGAGILAVAVLQRVEGAVDNRTTFLLNRYLSEKNLEGRTELWSLAVDAFLEHPILGIGYGQYRELALVELGRNISAHSSMLTIAAETGLVGLGLFVVVFGAVVLAGLDLKGRVPAAAFPAAFVVATVGQGLVADVHTFRALWIAVGIVVVVHADHLGSAVDVRDVSVPLPDADDGG